MVQNCIAVTAYLHCMHCMHFIHVCMHVHFSYKEGFECLKRAQLTSTDSEEDVLDGFEDLDRFNQYIVDIADTIWRNKAFEERSKSLCYSIPRYIAHS